MTHRRSRPKRRSNALILGADPSVLSENGKPKRLTTVGVVCLGDETSLLPMWTQPVLLNMRSQLDMWIQNSNHARSHKRSTAEETKKNLNYIINLNRPPNISIRMQIRWDKEKGYHRRIVMQKEKRSTILSSTAAPTIVNSVTATKSKNKCQEI